VTASTPARIAAEIKNTADREAATNFHPIDGANTHSPKEQVMSDLNRNPNADNHETVFIEGDGTNYTSHGEAGVVRTADRLSVTLPDRNGVPGALIDLTRADAVDFAHAILSAAGETVTIDGNHVDPLGRVWDDIDHDGRRYTEYATYMGEVRPTPDKWVEVTAYRLYFDDGTVQRHISVEANNPKLTAEQAEEAARHLTAAAAALDKTPEAGDA